LEEYPIRCAERIELIESLPSWSKIEELREVHSRHWMLDIAGPVGKLKKRELLILIVAEKHIQAMSSDVFKYFHCFSMLFLVRCIEPVPIDLQTSLFQMLRQNEDGAYSA